MMNDLFINRGENNLGVRVEINLVIIKIYYLILN